MPSNTVLKSWKSTEKEVVINWQDNYLKCQVNTQDKQTLISPHNIEGIPREILNDKAKLTLYLADSHIKLSELSDGNYRLHVFLKLKGGANTFDPDKNPDKLWPNAIIHYEIDSHTFPIAKNDRQKVLDAIKAWNDANTGFLFLPRTDKSQKDYLIFGEEIDRCYSKVGRMGGGQYLRCDLDSGSWHTGNLIHEIGHTVGLSHEHQRSDRNAFITVNSNDKTNYGIKGKNHGKYDFDSIMHYPLGQAIQLNFTMPQGAKVGQRERLSQGDIAAARHLASLGKNPDVFKNYAKELQLNNESLKAIEYFEIANRVFKTQKKNFDAECFYQIVVEQFKLKQLTEALETLNKMVKEIPNHNQFYQKAAACFYDIAQTQYKNNNFDEAKNTLKLLMDRYSKKNSYYANAQQLQKLIEEQVEKQKEISEGSEFDSDFNSSFDSFLTMESRQSNYRGRFFTSVSGDQERPREPGWKVIEQEANNLINSKQYKEASLYYNTLLNEYAPYMDNVTQAKWHNKYGLCAAYQGDLGIALQSFKMANLLDSTRAIYSKNIRLAERKIDDRYSYKSSSLNR